MAWRSQSNPSFLRKRGFGKVLLDFELRILLNGIKLLCLMHCTLNTEHHTKSIISTAWSQHEYNSKTRNSLKPMKINLSKANKYRGSCECKSSFPCSLERKQEIEISSIAAHHTNSNAFTFGNLNRLLYYLSSPFVSIVPSDIVSLAGWAQQPFFCSFVKICA